MGRPTDYKKEYDDLAYKFCLLHAKDTQLAEFFGVCEKTLNTWKQKYPSFLQSLKDGKERADAEVAKSLFHRAVGYSHPSEEIHVIAGKVVRTPTVKHYPPDTAAAFIWLKNRAGWKDKIEVDKKEEHHHKYTIEIIDLEERAKQLTSSRIHSVN